MNAPIDVTNIRIETPRLILRPWRQDDLQDLYAYAKEQGVGEMAGWKHHESPAESQKSLDLFMAHKKTLALERKGGGKVIGSLGIETLADVSELPEEWKGRELGYVLSRAYWGQGLMPEAVNAVMTFCFHTLDYDYLTCCHFLQNDQSRRVIEKCGFQYWKDVDYDTHLGNAEPSKLYICYHPNRKR